MRAPEHRLHALYTDHVIDVLITFCEGGHHDALVQCADDFVKLVHVSCRQNIDVVIDLSILVYR